MNINSLAKLIDVSIIRDTDFQYVDYCISECEGKYLSYIESDKYLSNINPNLSAIITTPELAPLIPSSIKGLAVTSEPKKMFVTVHNYVTKLNHKKNSFDSVIGNNCSISPTACIDAQNVIIGDNVVIGSNTVVKEGTVIENNVFVAENCVIGGKSFNYVKTNGGEVIAISDAGKTRLCCGVEICPNCHIARGTMASDETRLEENVKLDAYVHVGHGTHIGKRSLVTAGVKIAGNVRIGEDVWLGVNCTISNRINIGNGAKVSLGAVVTRDVNDMQVVSGNFAINHDRFLEHIRTIR